MKYFMMLVVMAVAGYFAFKQTRAKPAPPPPPPPAILTEPAPVISEAEQAKIVKAASDQDPLVRWEALLFLDKMNPARAQELFFEKLHKDQDVDLRVKILNALADKRAPEITQNVVWVLKDPDPDVRFAALQALEKIGDYATASAITELLRDADEKVKLQAIKTLNKLQDMKSEEIARERQRQEELRKQQEAEAARR